MIEFKVCDRVRRTAAYCAGDDAGGEWDRCASEVGLVGRRGGITSFAMAYPVRVVWPSGMVEIYSDDMLERVDD